MKIITGKRGCGKTTELIRLCAKYKHAVIVCPNNSQVVHVSIMAQKMGFNIPQPITFYDFTHKNYSKSNVDAFLFDNLDMSLSAVTDGESTIDAISFSDNRVKTNEIKKEDKVKCRRG